MRSDPEMIFIPRTSIGLEALEILGFWKNKSEKFHAIFEN
jgi:hypothetical protein